MSDQPRTRISFEIEIDDVDVLDTLVYLERQRGKRAGYVRELLQAHLSAQLRADPNVAQLVQAKRDWRNEHGEHRQSALKLVASNGRTL